MIPAQEARVIVRPTERGSPAPEVVTPTERGYPAPEAHRTIAGGKRGEAERAHRMGREERNIRPGGAAEPTRDKILLRPCRGGSVFGGLSVTGGCARLRLASHRLLSVAPSGAGEHHDNKLPARKCPAREDGPSLQSVVPGHSLPGSCTKRTDANTAA